MARIKVDLHDIYNNSAAIDRALQKAFEDAIEKKIREVEIILVQYPLESVTKFETKGMEFDPWVEKTGVEYLVDERCVISLKKRLGDCGAGRVTYTGGYVPPGATVGTGQTALPDDLEQAAVEQIAAWFIKITN